MTQGQKTMLQTAVVLAIAAGVGAYAYFGIVKKDELAQRTKQHDLRLFAPQKLDERQSDGGAATADFKTLVVTFKGERTELQRVNGVWRVIAPTEARADALVADAIVSYLQTSKLKGAVDEKPDQAALAKYGLAPPVFSVEATAEVNAELRTFALQGGIENTFDGTVFVRRDDDPVVYAAEGGARFTLAKSTFDLRSKQPAALDEAKLSTLELISLNNRWTLEREGPKKWNVVAPEKGRADHLNVSAMIGGAAAAKAQRFLDDSPERRQALGFDTPLLTLTATLLDGSVTTLRVVRQQHDGGTTVFVHRQGPDETVLAEVGEQATQFDRNLNELRDKAVLQVQPEQVTKLVFHSVGKPEVVLEKNSVDASAEAWRVVAPVAGKAKIFKVTGALWTLTSFKALAWGEEKPKDWAKFGIGASSPFVALYGQGGVELGRLTVGDLVPGTPTAHYVRGTRDQVLQSDTSRFAELPFELATVLDAPDAGL